MVWAIVLKTSNQAFVFTPRFQALRWQLLGYSLAIMMGVNLVSNILVYQFFSRSLYQQIDRRLEILADSAAHSLEDIKKDQQAVHQPTQRYLDHDHDLDLPWQNLQQSDQSIEWFNNKQKFLGRSGKINISSPLQLGFITLNQPPVRLLMIPVYDGKHQTPEKFLGYIRVAESTEEIDADLQQLFWGFSVGGIITFILIGVGGMWLTNQSLKPLAQSYEQLKQFTGDASHELRSPLTAIKTSVEVLQTHPERIHPQDVQKLANIVSATNQMGYLVEDLLLLARTDNDLDLTSPANLKIPIDELLDDVIALLESQAEQKFIALQTHYSKFAIIEGEAFQLQRLFTNLLDNAIKYTPISGQIDLTVQTNDKWVMVAIEDTGIGIETEQIPFVFDRFWRAEKARSPHVKGTGLGLAIAQSIAKRHGGDITVKSILGKGSCFTVRLPIAI